MDISEKRPLERWAQERGIPLTMDIVKSVILQCPLCQHSQKRKVPHTVMGHIGRDKLPGQIWQMDFIGQLPESRTCKYICTAVDTYSGLLVAFPCKSTTPLMRMLTPNLSINVAAKVESMIYWKINDKAKEPYRATPMSAGVDIYALNPDLIVPNTIKVVPTGIG